MTPPRPRPGRAGGSGPTRAPASADDAGPPWAKSRDCASTGVGISSNRVGKLERMDRSTGGRGELERPKTARRPPRRAFCLDAKGLAKPMPDLPPTHLRLRSAPAALTLRNRAPGARTAAVEGHGTAQISFAPRRRPRSRPGRQTTHRHLPPRARRSRPLAIARGARGRGRPTAVGRLKPYMPSSYLRASGLISVCFGKRRQDESRAEEPDT
jgi:hypothetical protein